MRWPTISSEPHRGPGDDVFHAPFVHLDTWKGEEGHEQNKAMLQVWAAPPWWSFQLFILILLLLPPILPLFLSSDPRSGPEQVPGPDPETTGHCSPGSGGSLRICLDLQLLHQDESDEEQTNYSPPSRQTRICPPPGTGFCLRRDKWFWERSLRVLGLKVPQLVSCFLCRVCIISTFWQSDLTTCIFS